MSSRNAFFLLLTFGFVFNASPAHSEDEPEMKEVDYVPPSPFEDPAYLGPKIYINAAARQLSLYEGMTLIKTYPIAVGSPGHKTPMGERVMKQIVWNPWWLPPDSPWAKGAKDTPPGPNNPLGPVKMDLGEAILVHGTNKPNSIGRAASHGCMRMKNEDAKELARMIQERYTQHTDPALFAEYQAHNRRSFYVKLDAPIPVKIGYDLAEIKDGQLHLYSDVYGRGAKRKKIVEDLLAANGYEIESINAELLADLIKDAKSKDVSLDVAVLTAPVFLSSSPQEQRTKAVAAAD